MKIELLQETEIGAGYYERVERLTPEGVGDPEVASVLPVRLRMGRGEFPNPESGGYTCPSYGESYIAVWRHRR